MTISPPYHAARLTTNPLIYSGLSEEIGNNINGPSIMEVPSWISHRLGRFYCYFAHHHGDHIRLAYADHISGPWCMYRGGV